MSNSLEWHDQHLEEDHLAEHDDPPRGLLSSARNYITNPGTEAGDEFLRQLIAWRDQGKRPPTPSPAAIRELHNGGPEEEDWDACD